LYVDANVNTSRSCGDLI